MTETIEHESSADHQQMVERATSMPSTADPDASMIAIIANYLNNPNANIDNLQKLLNLQESIAAKRARIEFDGALSRVQPFLPTIDQKGKIIVRDKNDQNKINQSTPYALQADIMEAIREPLSAHGLAISHRTGVTPEGKITVTGILSHAGGHREETTLALPHDATGSKNAVQAVGSSIAYGRRYTTLLLLNITSRAPQDGDDDGAGTGNGSAFITQDQVRDLSQKITDSGASLVKFLEYFGVESLPDLPAKRFDEATKKIAEAAKARAKRKESADAGKK